MKFIKYSFSLNNKFKYFKMIMIRNKFEMHSSVVTLSMSHLYSNYLNIKKKRKKN